MKSRELTIQQATREARRLVDRIMPGVGATVESRGSWDLDTDMPTMITRVTFPENDLRGYALYQALAGLPHRSIAVGSCSYVITRAR